MKTDLQTIKDTFKFSFEAYEASRIEAQEVEDLFHNKQYTESQLAIMRDRGQPAETFNIIKLFGRLLLGYYSTVVNTVQANPVHPRQVITASLLNDVISNVMRTNHMETEGDKIKLDGLLSGIMGCYIDVKDTDKKDQFGRVIRKVTLSHVPWQELVLDPLSRLEDYSDARFIHRYKWVSEEALRKLFKNKKEAIDKLNAYENHLQINDAEFERTFNVLFEGYFKRYDNYCLVHTIITDDNDKTWSVYWCGDEELSRKEVTYKDVKNPYRVHKVHISNTTEHYGIFREVIESQHAINQAVIKIQLMVNTQKAFVGKGGVEDIEEFKKLFNRVNAVIPVKDINKIKIENLSKEVVDQYTIIERSFDRIQKVLGVNDSFLGMAFASDSGRKVKLQQNSTTLSLRYITVRFEQFYRLLGWDIANLVKQYYTAYQVLRIVDETVGNRWVELNKPLTMWTGQFDEQGQPIMDFVWEEVLDPATQEPEKDEEGNYIIAPVPTTETDISFTDADIDIDSAIYNDEDEKNQLMLETILQGNIGSMLSQANPAGFFKAASLSVKTMKTKHSIDIAEILAQTSQMIAGGAVPAPEPVDATTPTKSATLKLPQNTNEGVAS